MATRRTGDRYPSRKSFGARTLRAVNQLLGEPAGTARRRTKAREGGFEQLEDRMLLSPVPIGSEFRVNTFTNGPQQTFFQTPQAVAVNRTTGDFVVTWSSHDQIGQGWDVYAQRYNAAGVPQGSEFLVNTTTTNDQEYSSVAMDANGDFVITWSGHQSGNWDVYAQRYNAAGVAQGPEMLVNSITARDQMFSTVAMDGQGRFVITWSGDQSGPWAVYAREFNQNGNPQGGEFQVSSPFAGADNQLYSDVAMNGNGNFVITWSGQASLLHLGLFSHWNVYAQEYGIGGNPRGGIFQVNTTTTDDREYSTVGLDAVGNFVIAWSSHNEDGSGWGVYARRFLASGTPLTNEFQVNTTTHDDQEFPSVAMNASGNFLVTWSSDNQDGSGWGVYAQAFGQQGQPQGGEFRVNTYTPGDQLFSSAAMDSSGHVVIVWSSDNQDGSSWGVYGQRYSPAAITVTPTAGLVTTESGGTATFSVALNEQPTAAVTVALSSSDPSQGALSQTSLTFTPADWNIAQTVTVTGLDDHIVNGDQTYQITGTAFSTDSSFNGQAMPAVTVTNKEADVAGITVTPTSGLVTNEAGGTATFSVVLTSQPLADVMIGLASSNPREGTVSTPALVFTPANWNVPQTVTVTGVDDGTFNGNVAYAIVTDPAVSLDPTYAGMKPPDVSLTNLEVATAGISISPTSGLVTTQAGGTASFTVVLQAPPIADVTIPLASSNPLAGTLDRSSVTFTPLDWNVPQSVTITGVDDHIARGDVAYQILTGPAVSLDPRYAGQKPPDVSVTNKQTDVAGITVTPTSGLVTTKAGGTATFQVVLATQPLADVTIGLRSSNPSEGTVSASALTFTAANWNVPQTVTVTGVDDGTFNGNVAYAIVTDPAVSLDPFYNGLDPADVAVLNEQPQLTVTPVPQIAGTEGQPLSGVVASFTDTVAQNAGDFRATIDWGDGTTSVGTVTANSSGGFDVAAGHTYAEDGSYPVAVTIQNAHGPSATAGTTAAMADAPLAAAGSNFGVLAGTTFNGVVATLNDTNAAAPVGDFSATIDWGDGKVSSGTVMANGSGAFEVAGSHAYTALGSYAVTVTVQDAGGATATVTSTATVADILTFAAGPLPITAVAGVRTGTQLLATFTDASPAGRMSAYTALIDWGDRTTTMGLVTANPGGGFDVSGSHAYAQTGSYAVSITIERSGVHPLTGTALASVADAPATAPGNIGNTQAGAPVAAVLAPALPAGSPETIVPGTLVVVAGGSSVASPIQTTAVTDTSSLGPGRLGSSAGGGGGPAAIDATPAKPDDKGAVTKTTAPLSKPADPAVKQSAGSPGTNTPVGPSTPAPVGAGPLPITTVPPEERTPTLKTDLLRTQLDTMAKQLETQSLPRRVGIVLTTGAIASAGYVYLTTRGASWLLSVLTSRPLWKRLDPLDVLFAWEKEKKRRRAEAKKQEPDEEDKETLQSLVD